jgi:hypothetical protein
MHRFALVNLRQSLNGNALAGTGSKVIRVSSGRVRVNQAIFEQRTNRRRLDYSEACLGGKRSSKRDAWMSAYPSIRDVKRMVAGTGALL